MKISRAKRRAKIENDMNYAGNESWKWKMMYEELKSKLVRFDRYTLRLRKLKNINP
jgi:hypothetical protein